MNAIRKQSVNPNFAGSLAIVAVAAFSGGTQQVTANGTDLLPGTLIKALDYTDSGSTFGALSNVAGQFSGYAQAGPDVFYTFTVFTPGVMTFLVTPQVGYDVGIGLYQGGSVVSGATADFNFESVPETFSWAVTAGQTYTLAVDSYYPSTVPQSQGTYDLKITGDGRVSLVPEPGSALLVGLAAIAMGWRRRRSAI